jgi:hypothetical protein
VYKKKRMKKTKNKKQTQNEQKEEWGKMNKTQATNPNTNKHKHNYFLVKNRTNWSGGQSSKLASQRFKSSVTFKINKQTKQTQTKILFDQK